MNAPASSSKLPVPKVAATGAAAAAATVLVFIAQRAGADLPPEIAAAIVAVVAFAAGWIKKG